MKHRSAEIESIERRLREEAPRVGSLPATFARDLSRRLDAYDPLTIGAGRERRRNWLVPAGGVALAAAVVLAAFLTTSWPMGRPAVGPGPQMGASRIARALGEGMHAALGGNAAVSAIGERSDPLALETRRLLADARQLADRLIGPVRPLEAQRTQ